VFIPGVSGGGFGTPRRDRNEDELGERHRPGLTTTRTL
jgi:hypothetical protein